MNCEALAASILDMARGAAVPEEARLDVRRHMETCSSCAAAYARQRDLTTALQALAGEAQDWRASAAMEQRLLAAFAMQQRHELPVGTRASANLWRHVLATAAVLTLAVWGIREVGEIGRREAERPSAKASAVETDGKATVAHRPPSIPAKASAFAKATADKTADQTGNKTAGGPATPRTATPRTATPVEFVRIPSAIGLPELESGTVLRVELPLTALPEYGLAIAPDAVRTSVEADVLVGQDGQPRAIRLIGGPEPVAQDPRSRQ